MSTPIEVPDGSPASLAARHAGDRGRARGDGREAPEQWYTFKPMWPATAAESARWRRARRGAAERGVSATRPAPVAAARGRPRVLRLIVALLAVAQRLPDRPVYRVAYALGAGLSLVMPARRALVRRNLARVCALARRARAGEPAVSARRPVTAGALDRARARDVRPLGRLVRRVGARTALRRRRAARAHPCPLDPEAAAAGPRAPRSRASVGSIQLAMHFGSVDLSGLYATRVGAVAA